MRPDDVVRLRHMIEAAETIARFVAGRRREDLERDLTLAFVITRAIEIFGEAASRLSPEVQKAVPGVRWPAVIAARDRLIPAYFDIDHDIIWGAATEENPALLLLLVSALSKD